MKHTQRRNDWFVYDKTATKRELLIIGIWLDKTCDRRCFDLLLLLCFFRGKNQCQSKEWPFLFCITICVRSISHEKVSLPYPLPTQTLKLNTHTLAGRVLKWRNSLHYLEFYLLRVRFWQLMGLCTERTDDCSPINRSMSGIVLNLGAFFFNFQTEET